MPVQKWITAKLRRLVPIVAVLALLGGGAVAVNVATAVPALAGTNTYPWADATCVTPNPNLTPPACAGSVTYDNWGYSKCPSNDTGCMGLYGYLNGVKYGEEDPWGEYLRNCTSYVAWMLSSENGFTMPFHDDAVNWGTDAQNLNYTVNMTPKAGSVFWDKTHDHVGWVESVSSDGSQVTYEDYNSNYDGNWGQHTVATSSASGYIHFKDLPGGTGGGSSTGDLAKNGGFNNGTSPWTSPGGYFGVYQDSYAYEGSGRAATSASAGGDGFYQDVSQTITSGDTYCASAEVTTAGSGTGGSGQFVLWLTGGTSEKSSVSFSNLPSGNSGQWETVHTCVEATNNNHNQLRIQFYPTVGGQTIWVDAVDVP